MEGPVVRVNACPIDRVRLHRGNIQSMGYLQKKTLLRGKELLQDFFSGVVVKQDPRTGLSNTHMINRWVAF